MSSKVLLSIQTLTTAGISETIRRNIGGIYVMSDQGAATELQHGAFGITVANDLALAAGAASLPGPITDMDDDGWMVWQGFTQGMLFASAVGLQGANFGMWYPFDSRAMRRVEEGYGLAMMVENQDAAHVVQVGVVISTYATRN